jgi:PAS domain S-box-containing protein
LLDAEKRQLERIVHKLAVTARPWAYAAQVSILAAAYFAVAKLSLLLAVPPGYASAMESGSGIALAALLLFGSRLWPGVWVGAAAALFTVEDSALAAGTMASGLTLSVLAAAALIRRHVGVPYRFTRVDQVVKFVAFCGAAAMISATLGLLAIAVTHPLARWELVLNWWAWWQGDVTGMILLTPLLLSWIAPGTVRWSSDKAIEGALFGALLLAACYIIFNDTGARSTAFILVPFIVWAAFRFGQRETNSAVAAVSVIALWYTISEQTGPFAGAPVYESLLILLTFIGTLMFTGLVLRTVLHQLDQAMQELQQKQRELETRVRERTLALEQANRRLQEDISARQRAERMLQETEQRFRLMVESVVDYAIFMLDPEGRVTSWNAGAQRIKGYAAEDILGEHLSRFYAQEDLEQRKPERELAVAAAEGRFEDEGWRVRRDGSMFWAHFVITAVRDESGALLGFAKVTRDLTERNRVEADLIRSKVAAEKASEAKSQFLANMSHELRTPLNSLLILAKLLADNVGGNLTPKQVKFADTIYASGMDLLSLINDLLDLAKIESGAITKLDIAPSPVADVRTDLERTFSQIAQEKSLRFAISIDRDVPETIPTDMPRLKQVLKNLLANSFKFTRQGEVALRVSLARSGWSATHPRLAPAPGVIAFSVSDTGIGIPEEKQKVIFEAFQQADGGTSRQYGGTGLGLSISRELTRLLGGEIGVHSTPGKGSVFTVYLPLAEQAATQLSRSSSS